MPQANGLARLLAAVTARYQACDAPMASILAQATTRAATGAIKDTSAGVVPNACYRAALDAGDDPIVHEIRAVGDQLCWRVPGSGAIPEAMASRMLATEIVGPDGMIHSDGCRWGLFLQEPGLHYPEHSHAAEELYYVLSGTADWGTEAGPPAPVRPGSFVHHPSWLAHVMITGEEPLLAMWGWTGDIDLKTYKMGRRDD